MFVFKASTRNTLPSSSHCTSALHEIASPAVITNISQNPMISLRGVPSTRPARDCPTTSTRKSTRHFQLGTKRHITSCQINVLAISLGDCPKQVAARKDSLDMFVQADIIIVTMVPRLPGSELFVPKFGLLNRSFCSFFLGQTGKHRAD